jgi:hypothetical protein
VERYLVAAGPTRINFAASGSSATGHFETKPEALPARVYGLVLLREPTRKAVEHHQVREQLLSLVNRHRVAWMGWCVGGADLHHSALADHACFGLART